MAERRKSVYQFRFGARQLWILLTGLLAIFTLTFVLGFLVGKSSSPMQDWVAKGLKDSKEKRAKSPRVHFTAAEAENRPAKVKKRTRRVKKALKRPSPSPPAKKPKPSGEMVRVVVPRKKAPAAPPAEKLASPKKAAKKGIQGLDTLGKSAGLKKRLSSIFVRPRPKVDLSPPKPSAAPPSAGPVKLDGRPDSPVIMAPGLTRAPDADGKPALAKSPPLEKAGAKEWFFAKPLAPPLEAEPVPTHVGQVGGKGAVAAIPVDGGLRKVAVRGKDGPSEDPIDDIPKEVQYSREGRYYIQVGSYPDRRAAVKQREALRKNAYAASIREADLGAKGKWYRVIVGRFQTLDRAAEEAERLAKTERVTPRIFKDGEPEGP